ncbi:MarR family transcriptional regulator [Bacillus sp. UFRGS-B20]|nr:MarR family transcriptional regulator [Bacillus sp. UFRGS-B20]
MKYRTVCQFHYYGQAFLQEKRDYKIISIIPRIPPKVEYSLTEHGKTVSTVLDSVCSWEEVFRTYR